MSYLDLYEENTKYKKKKRKKKIKKSNHKHDYQDCVVCDNKNLYFISRCSICGKVGSFSDSGKEFLKNEFSYFKEWHLFFNFCNLEKLLKEEKDFIEKTSKKIPIFYVESFDIFDTKYL